MSSIAAFSFGAFGDFVAILELTLNVRKLLNSSVGASQEYLALLLEVDRLVRILEIATTATTSIRLSQVSPHLVSKGRDALILSQSILKDLETKIRTYQEKLRKGGSERMMIESWRKIGWGLLVKDDEFTRLRWQLMSNVRTMDCVLSLIQCTRVDVLQQQNQVMLNRLDKCLPKSMGYTWEGGSTVDTAPILLRDMYDNLVSIPLDLCATPELFDRLLKIYFKDRTGNRFIVKGDYELTTAGSNSLLNLVGPAEWTTTMKPGIVLNMNAIIRRKSRPNQRSDTECPCCRRIIVGVRVDVPTVCPHPDCETSFTISRTDVDDPTLVLNREYMLSLNRIMEPLDPHYFLGPSGWRLEHAQELKKSYAESRRLRHIRILDWLPIMHAFHIPKFQDGHPLTYYNTTGQEVPVLWKGTRTLSNVWRLFEQYNVRD